ncbi:uncharacterized protein METZ01_LOCUS511257, partial [marine metagenome]
MPVPIRLFCLLQTIGLFLAHQGNGKIDFNRDIKPLLSNRCFACHGPDEGKRKAKLRLDVFEGATRDLDGYSAIVPG